MNIQEYINKEVLKNTEAASTVALFPTYRKTIKKNEILTHFGEIEHKAYFLISGITESAIEKDGELKIIDFVFPNHFICSYTSFLLQTPSEIQTKAITGCEVEYFLKADLEKAYKHSIVANQFGRYVTEQFFISKLKRENDFLTKSAKEVYLELIKGRPEVLQKIPVNKIAKYLGIHPESLSRIRAEIIS